MAARGLTDVRICMSPKGTQGLRKSAGISVKPWVYIYVTVSIAVQHNFFRTTWLQQYGDKSTIIAVIITFQSYW